MRETKKKDGKESHQVVKSLRQVASPNSEKQATIVFCRHCAVIGEPSRRGMIILASGECSAEWRFLRLPRGLVGHDQEYASANGSSGHGIDWTDDHALRCCAIMFQHHVSL